MVELSDTSGRVLGYTTLEMLVASGQRLPAPQPERIILTVDSKEQTQNYGYFVGLTISVVGL